ncbi:DUF742 domain-containing protein [Streptomyces sp. URMC 123]|uniref:DUF742 domain-containing protein n=1 Tax=Streptomyces sp. URMC 123 TaxID=3423403 RepID=UPI003F19E272
MATPPSGSQHPESWPYGSGQQPQPQGEPAPNRFNFPSSPSRQTPPPQAPPPQQPYGRQQPSYEQPRAPQQGRHQRPRQGRPAGGGSPLVRPYAMTGGRTRPRYQLAIEALVHTTALPAQLQGQLPEHQRICHLCREIKSVAEISALLSIPLGVARILVADLAEAGLVAIHQPGGDETAGGQPDVTLLERVLSGLRKL